MGTAQAAAVAVGAIATMVTVPLHKRLIPSSIAIDNQGLVPHTIYLRDDFTPDAYDGVASPGAQTIVKGQWTVASGITALLEGDDLKGLSFLGALKEYADAADASCVITVNYEFE